MEWKIQDIYEHFRSLMDGEGVIYHILLNLQQQQFKTITSMLVLLTKVHGKKKLKDKFRGPVLWLN